MRRTHLERLLTAIAYHDPETVFLCGDEVAQLSREGWFAVQRGRRRVICRNHGPRPTRAAVEIDGEPLDFHLPRGETVVLLEARAQAA